MIKCSRSITSQNRNKPSTTVKHTYSTFPEKQQAHLSAAVSCARFSVNLRLIVHIVSALLLFLPWSRTMCENQSPPALKEEQIIWTPGLERSVNLLGLWLDRQTQTDISNETRWTSLHVFNGTALTGGSGSWIQLPLHTVLLVHTYFLNRFSTRSIKQ